MSNQHWSEKIRLVIDGFTLIVLFFTMIGVFWYACIASQQNANLAKSVAQEVMVNRPVVFANAIRSEGTDAYPLQASVVIVNFGKTVALEVIAPGEIASAASEEPAPRDSRCNEDGEPPKQLYMTALAQVDAIAGHPAYYTANWKLTSDENIGKMAGRALYAVGCVYYKGLDGARYYSDVCAKWIGDGFEPCESRDRNRVH